MGLPGAEGAPDHDGEADEGDQDKQAGQRLLAHVVHSEGGERRTCGDAKGEGDQRGLGVVLFPESKAAPCGGAAVKVVRCDEHRPPRSRARPASWVGDLQDVVSVPSFGRKRTPDAFSQP